MSSAWPDSIVSCAFGIWYSGISNTPITASATMEKEKLLLRPHLSVVVIKGDAAQPIMRWSTPEHEHDGWLIYARVGVCLVSLTRSGEFRMLSRVPPLLQTWLTDVLHVVDTASDRLTVYTHGAHGLSKDTCTVVTRTQCTPCA